MKWYSNLFTLCVVWEILLHFGFVPVGVAVHEAVKEGMRGADVDNGACVSLWGEESGKVDFEWWCELLWLLLLLCFGSLFFGLRLWNLGKAIRVCLELTNCWPFTDE